MRITLKSLKACMKQPKKVILRTLVGQTNQEHSLTFQRSDVYIQVICKYFLNHICH